MSVTNITRAVFGGGKNTTTATLHQYDYGQVLKIEGLALPSAYEVHFGNHPLVGTTTTQIGNADGVAIPDQYLTTGENVFAWIFLHAGEDDGRTCYMITIPVRKRPQPTDEPPTPEQQSVITETIAALNVAVNEAESARDAITDMSVTARTLAEGNPASVEKKVDPETGAITLEFGIPQGEAGRDGRDGKDGKDGRDGEDGATGPQGERGEQGAKGDKGDKGDTGAQGPAGATGPQGPQGLTGSDGADGFSPVVEVTDIEGGHRVTITDAEGTHSFDVYDGQDGRPSSTLITRLVTASAVSAVIVGGNGSFALKHAEINIFIPETTVPSGSTSVTLRLTVNDVDTAGSYSYNSGVANSINLGQFRHGGSRAQVQLNSVGRVNSYVLVGIAPSMSFYMDNSTPNAVAERYTVATINEGSVWENITKIKLFPSSSSYSIPAGAVVEIWGY